MMRLVFASSLALLAPAVAAAEDAGDLLAGAAELDRAAMVSEVLARNPSLTAARSALRAAEERPAQASALADPMLSWGVAPESLGSSTVDFGQELELGQELPYPGKRRLRGDLAAAEAEASRQDVESLRLELAMRASLLFDDYYQVHRALAINAEHVALLEDFQRVATARYAAGLAAQQDPLQAEVELAHLLHDGVILGSEREIVVAEINALLHRTPGASLPPPPAELAPPARGTVEEAGLEEQALAARPALRALDEMVRARQAEVELARLEGRPDFGVMSSYNSMWSDSEHRFMVGAGINLPIWRTRVRAGIAEAEARLAAAQSEREALVDEIRREVRTAGQRLGEAHHILELYESRMLPAASDQVQAALSGFRTGRNDFLALIEAERSLRTFKLGYHEAIASLYRHRAELDRAVGRLPLEATAPALAPSSAGENR
ncbi:MAG: TolC family protein [Thermoanaerobaculia bacterium]